MDSAALQSSASQPSRHMGEWLDVRTAAGRMGVSERRIRQLCVGRWLAQGLAEQRPTPGGGQPAWFVSESADPALSRIKSPEQLSWEFDPSRLTDAQQKQIAERKRIVDDWQTAVSGGLTLGFSRAQITAQFIQRLNIGRDIKVSRRTLYNWHSAWRRDGLAGLLDARTGSRSRSDLDDSDPFIACVLRTYLTEKAPSLTDCHWFAMESAKEHGWKTYSYSQVKRYIATLPKQLVILKREGHDAFVDQCEPFFERDYSTLASNEMWCGDDHVFDVWVVAPGGELVRPYISGWEDLRSRKLVGHTIYTHAPNTDVILEAWVVGVKSHGLPQSVYIDNGKTYDSRQLQGRTKKQRQKGVDPIRQDAAWQAFDVKVHHAWPFHGQSKPIERMFGSICKRFSKWWDTYCGGSPDSRPGDVRDQIAAGKAPTLAEFRQAFQNWLDGVYHARPHSGDGMDGRSPNEVFENHLSAKVTVPDEILHFLTLPRFGPVKVGQHGVVWEGLHYGGFDQAVQARFGQMVYVAVDAKDISSVLVLDQDGRLICRAKKNLKIGNNADRQVVRAAIQEKKALRRTLRSYLDKRPHLSDDMHRIVSRKAAEVRAAQAADPSEPPPTKIHRAAFDDRFVGVRGAFESASRMAVGAERFQSLARNNGDADEDAAADAPFTYNGHGSAEEES